MLTKITIEGLKNFNLATIDFYTNSTIANKNKKVTIKHELKNTNLKFYTFNLLNIKGDIISSNISFLDIIYLYKTISTNDLQITDKNLKLINQFAKNKKQFQVEYLIDSILIKHTIKLNKNFKILKQRLEYLKTIKNKVKKWKIIFENKKQSSLLANIFNNFSFIIKNNLSITNYEYQLINKIYKSIKNINIYDQGYHFQENEYKFFLEHLSQLSNTEIKKQLALFKIITNCIDLNIIDFSYNNIFEAIIVQIKRDKKNLKVTFEELSDNVKKICYWIMAILRKNNDNNIYIINEIDTYFHLKIVKLILNLFYYNDNNINRHQLIFTLSKEYILDIVGINNSCINISLTDENEITKFVKLSNFETYANKTKNKFFTKNKDLEKIDKLYAKNINKIKLECP